MVKLLASMGVVFLMAGLLGPIYDHHFAERLPLHSHITFSAGVAAHIHGFQVPHCHQGTQQDSHGTSDRTASPDALVALASGEALSVAFAAVDVSPLQTVSSALEMAGATLAPIFSRDPSPLSAVSHSPLTLPPRIVV